MEPTTKQSVLRKGSILRNIIEIIVAILVVFYLKLQFNYLTLESIGKFTDMLGAFGEAIAPLLYFFGGAIIGLAVMKWFPKFAITITILWLLLSFVSL
jgi:hypothetical protein